MSRVWPGVVLLVACCFWRPAEAADATALVGALDSISTAELQAYTDVLSNDTYEGREAGSRGGQAAGRYLVDLLSRRQVHPAGDQGSYIQEFGSGYRNVLAMLEGSDPQLRQQVIVIGAHYDHVGYGTPQNSYGPTGYIHNGADDNASGVAGVLEVLDALTRPGAGLSRSVLFAFWDAEEKGLLGSKHWLQHPTVACERIVMAINLDMIGRLRQDRLEVYGIRTSSGLRRLLAEANRHADLVLEYSWELREDSDHYSFYEHNIPTLMLHTGLHADYHRPSDDVEKLNLQGMCRVTRLVTALLCTLDAQPALPTFRPACRQERLGDQLRLEQPLPARQGRLGIRYTPAEDAAGVVLTEVQADSPAARAGLKGGERIVSFAGRRVDPARFSAMVLAAQSPLELLVAAAESRAIRKVRVELAGVPVRVGLTLRADEAEPAAALVAGVMPGSPAELAGLLPRDRIYSVNGKGFSNVDELRELLLRLPSPLVIEYERRGRLGEAVVELAELPATDSLTPTPPGP
ncbi:MAG: M20/M25/M40 family metallo-hydrolase [Pirellulales bacterium]|nr:M20/M25/M40 family metallo-hydrolase [Pirellulales bacterium]